MSKITNLTESSFLNPSYTDENHPSLEQFARHDALTNNEKKLAILSPELDEHFVAKVQRRFRLGSTEPKIEISNLVFLLEKNGSLPRCDREFDELIKQEIKSQVIRYNSIFNENNQIVGQQKELFEELSIEYRQKSLEQDEQYKRDQKLKEAAIGRSPQLKSRRAIDQKNSYVIKPVEVTKPYIVKNGKIPEYPSIKQKAPSQQHSPQKEQTAVNPQPSEYLQTEKSRTLQTRRELLLKLYFGATAIGSAIVLKSLSNEAKLSPLSKNLINPIRAGIVDIQELNKMTKPEKIELIKAREKETRRKFMERLRRQSTM